MINIYKLTCETGKNYYGSTSRELRIRLNEHKSKNQVCSSKDFINPKIELLETCEKEQQKKRESYYIKKFDCVNVSIPNRSQKEWKENNKDKTRLINNKSYHNRKEIINELRKGNRDKKIVCECGTLTNKDNLSRHKRTKKHLKKIEDLI
tara:strand:- start:8 stop:457 length:450 start_codon:yes stop_codon:yes gene_type:complete